MIFHYNDTYEYFSILKLIYHDLLILDKRKNVACNYLIDVEIP